jgi:hypothetical protein
MGFVSLASVQQNAATESATIGYTMKVVTITDTYSSSQTINTANGVKIGLSAPAAPTQLSLDTQDPSRIIVSWGAPTSDGGFAIEDYDVQVNGQTICANIQARMCEVGTLSPSVTYNVSVMARNALGLGEAAVASHTTPAPPVVISVVPNPVTPTVSPTVSPTPKPTASPTVKPTPKPTSSGGSGNGSGGSDSGGGSQSGSETEETPTTEPTSSPEETSEPTEPGETESASPAPTESSEATENQETSGFAPENLLWLVLVGLVLWFVFRRIRSTREDQ